MSTMWSRRGVAAAHTGVNGALNISTGREVGVVELVEALGAPL
jgi:hypothetical protein